MSELIRLEMRDWLYNAGLLGVYRILKHNNEYVKVGINYIEFYKNSLDKFGAKLLNYLVDKYKNFLPYHEMMKREYVVNNFKEDTFEDSVKAINDTIELLKKILNPQGTSYYKYYKDEIYLLLKDETLLKLAKSLKKISDKDKSKFEVVKAQVDILKEIFDYMKQDNVKTLIQYKDVAQKIIKNQWNKVAFLNGSSGGKKRDMIEEYNDYFVEAFIEQLRYLEEDKRKVEGVCICCNEDIEKIMPRKSGDAIRRSFSFSFVNNMGVDANKKVGHFYDSNESLICPICNLVYSCIVCGFNQLNKSGLFINQNSSFDKLIKANNISINMSDTLDELENKSYYAILNTIEQDKVKALSKELDNIQVIKFEVVNSKTKYSFNILNRKLMKVILNNKDSLEKLLKYTSVALDDGSYIDIYKEVISRLYNNQNLFDLIKKLIRYYSVEKFKFLKNSAIYVIKLVIIINNDFINNINNNKGVFKMEEIKDVWKAIGVGERLHDEYVKNKMENKIGNVVYRLNNIIDTNNKDEFVKSIIKVYSYFLNSGNTKLISDLKHFAFLNSNVDTQVFKSFANSFLIGLISGSNKNKKDE